MGTVILSVIAVCVLSVLVAMAIEWAKDLTARMERIESLLTQENESTTAKNLTETGA